MRITLLQTADPERYAQLLMISSQIAQSYCTLHGLDYEMTLGIRYGRKPWHASLNRIPILKEYCDRGYDGWVLYIDADAIIVDLNFNLRSYLAERRHAALVVAPSGVLPPRWWDVNIGVFAINLAHPLARQLVDAWYAKLQSVSPDALAAEERWGDVADDQEMVHWVMQHIEGLEQAVVHDEYPHVINWKGSFISQHVRESGSFTDRVENLARQAALVLGNGAEDNAWHGATAHAAKAHANAEFVAALYAVLLRREPDENGFRSAVHALNTGMVNYAQELRNCLSSPEFRHGIEAFLDRRPKERCGVRYRDNCVDRIYPAMPNGRAAKLVLRPSAGRRRHDKHGELCSIDNSHAERPDQSGRSMHHDAWIRARMRRVMSRPI